MWSEKIFTIYTNLREVLDFFRENEIDFAIKRSSLIVTKRKIVIIPSYPVDTRCRFNVDTTSYDVVRRRIDVEITSCVYWVAATLEKSNSSNWKIDTLKK